MNANAATRLAAFALAAVTSLGILTATVTGMQPRTGAQPQLIALDTVTVTATRAN